MPLTRVTITGADDQTEITDMVELSRDYPFVEWGILVSCSHSGFVMGRNDRRFPSRPWIDLFCLAAGEENLKVSTHICGKWVRELLVGELDWARIPKCLTVSQRIQINTHAAVHASTSKMFGNLSLIDGTTGKQIIFQWDGVNNHLAMAARAFPSLFVAALFDTSGGVGILPKSWPIPIQGLHCGYAGGLGPDNVCKEAEAIDIICGSERNFWIDMERRVRTDDDSRLDMEKVRAVLQACAPLVER